MGGIFLKTQHVFKRYELKYLISHQQKEIILQAMKPYMEIDQYGKTTIRNIYYDTDTYLLIRRSIDKPIFKEKIRIRSYRKDSSTVFIELKRKYQNLVYKRRIQCTYEEALQLFEHQKSSSNHQINQEILYFIQHYMNLQPKLFLSYDREAYYCKDDSDFRVTFDEHILCHQDHLSIDNDIYGTSLLEDGMVLMEVKCSQGIPLWFTHVLTKEHIYKTSFSKYGIAYQKLLFQH